GSGRRKEVGPQRTGQDERDIAFCEAAVRPEPGAVQLIEPMLAVASAECHALRSDHGDIAFTLTRQVKKAAGIFTQQRRVDPGQRGEKVANLAVIEIVENVNADEPAE